MPSLRDARVLHAVTLHTPQNSFGGPTRVALNLCSGLREHGVDARLLALGDGFDGPLPDEVEGVPADLLPARHVLPKFEVSGITSPALWRGLRARVRTFDLVHVHLMRDLVTLPVAVAALATGTPLVLQTHGMVDPSGKVLARVVDAVAARRVLRRADAICYLTEFERTGLDATARTHLTRAHRLINGVPLGERREQPAVPTVLYLARLQERKRPEVFVRMIPQVLARHPEARFVLAGPDSGSRDGAVRLAEELGVSGSLTVPGGLDHEAALAELRRASVYVLPSVDEPFPVSVLEALSFGVPTVVTSTNGLSGEIGPAGAGAVADEVDTIAAEVLRLLDPAANDEASAAAHALARGTFSLDAVVDRLVGIYQGAVDRHPGAGTGGPRSS